MFERFSEYDQQRLLAFGELIVADMPDGAKFKADGDVERAVFRVPDADPVYWKHVNMLRSANNNECPKRWARTITRLARARR